MRIRSEEGWHEASLSNLHFRELEVLLSSVLKLGLLGFLLGNFPSLYGLVIGGNNV